MDNKFVELLTKELTGEITLDESNELQAFLSKNSIYQTHYKTFKMYWENKEAEYTDNTFSFKKVQSKILKHESLNNAEDNASQPTPVHNSLFYFWRNIAAVLVIGLVCCFLYGYFSASNTVITFQEKITPKRTKSIIVLSDGTRITLNSGSSLKYPSMFAGKTREVYLSGEAFFDVHKDHRHPFIIHTGKMNVKVLGTEFNIRSYPNETLTETSLIRGSIEVTLADRPSDHIILKPKEKLIVKNNNLKAAITDKQTSDTSDTNLTTQYALTSITHLNSLDTNVVETSWLKNKLVANNEEFVDLAQNMDRWYGVEIHFSNPDLEKLRFTVSFEKENINQALYSLQLTEKFHYKIDKSNIYIY